MRDLMILIFTVFSFNIVMTAQVKNQFRDRDNSSTIVVVKEDHANDQAVLNDYFDLADMSMSDQIMIMTTSEELMSTTAPDMENSTSSTDPDIELFFAENESEKIVIEAQETPAITDVNSEEPELVRTEKVIHVAKPTKVSSGTKAASTRAKGNYTVKNSADVKRAARKKYFGKRKSKKRRKTFRKNKIKKCYKF